MIFDTSFLIELEMEARAGRAGSASEFLSGLPAETPACTAAACVVEFEEGYPSEALPMARLLLARFAVCEVTVDVARRAARVRRELRLAGALIGDFDILIAATALDRDMPLVTDNTKHFERVSGLRLRDFRGAASA